MSGILKALVVSATMLYVPSPAAAQPGGASPRRAVSVLGLAAAGYNSPHPEGGPVGLGASLGVVRSIGLRTEVRVQITWLETWVTADDIALCHPLLDGGCLPDSVFPDRLWLLEVHTGFRLFPTTPLWVLAGGGLVAPQGARPGQGGGDESEAPAGMRATWRLGIESAVGRSSTAPRLQLTRSGYSHSMLSLSGMVTLAVLFPLAP
jgi:hypothetical protein